MGKQPAFMDLDFERVVYAKNPLSEVSFKIDFAPLLEIETEVPAGFHKKIREQFPLFKIEENFSISLGNSPGQSEPVIPSRSYLFLTQDSQSTIKLSKDSFELITNTYVKWENFRCEALTILDNLFECYQLQYLQKVSLQYQNIIDPGKLGLEDLKWGDLLKPSVSGWVGDEKISACLASAFSSSVFYEIGNDKIHSRSETIENIETNKKAVLLTNHFSIDIDTEQITQEYIFSHAERLYTYTGKLFRSCITQRLHETLCARPKQTGNK